MKKSELRKIIREEIRSVLENEKWTSSDFYTFEKYADDLFAAVGIDVALTKHFKDRVNDPRNLEQITIEELKDMMNEVLTQYEDLFIDSKGQIEDDIRKKIERVIADMVTDINVPFVLQWDDRNNEVDLVLKTVMRNRDIRNPFHAKQPKLPI